ncbi:SRPBCC family protein [Streptomyces sp. NPDC006798]|uniref:SRPBCC family protein n=1 Tax=Streptomyces sp. NPDC006798 TaxID=3155462 RepID=UPI0033E18483
MDWFRYRFHCVWDIDAPPEAVFAALARPADYPRWWPQVRAVTDLGDGRGSARFRSLLPYELAVTARAVRRDPESGVLQIDLRGDLEGWARWTVGPRGPGTRAVYDQEVEIRRPLMRRLAVPCRPLFRANHTVMMRAGRAGLGRYLGSGLSI